ncbi:MAG TPA: ribonuclease HII [Fibrobacteria bacterium]|nr:ribonuclease HII [Fibrobacteria bacterium]
MTTKSRSGSVLTDPDGRLARPVAGVDEAGRGPLAGPVVAAAVVAPDGWVLRGLDDSKKLSETVRRGLASIIRSDPELSWGVGWATAEEIDSLNILQATFLAMRRALEGLGKSPAAIVVDGNRCIPGLDLPQMAVVEGDGKILSIAAASILAKTARDSWMVEQEPLHPGYGFSIHKGYPTPRHLEALDRLGPCALHRTSFAPVRRCLARSSGGRIL